jgi:hypothetical protein
MDWPRDLRRGPDVMIAADVGAQLDALRLQLTAATEYGQLKARQLTDQVTECIGLRQSLTAAEKQAQLQAALAETSRSCANAMADQLIAAESRVKELERYEHIEAQFGETGPKWWGARYKMPQGYEEVSNDSGVPVILAKGDGR